jgi:hypothetical protein
VAVRSYFYFRVLSFDPNHQLHLLVWFLSLISHPPITWATEHRELLRRLKPEQLSCWAEKWWCIGNWITYFLSLIINDSMQAGKRQSKQCRGENGKGLGFPNLMKLVSTLCLETLLSTLIIPSTQFPVCVIIINPPTQMCASVCVFLEANEMWFEFTGLHKYLIEYFMGYSSTQHVSFFKNSWKLRFKFLNNYTFWEDPLKFENS